MQIKKYLLHDNQTILIDYPDGYYNNIAPLRILRQHVDSPS